MIVIVESPYAGDTDANFKYCVRACVDCFRRGETPFASHLIYPHVLDELNPEERERGITAGYEFWPSARKIVFYVDNGWSSGMMRALNRCVGNQLGFQIYGRYFDRPTDLPNLSEELFHWLKIHPVQMEAVL